MVTAKTVPELQDNRPELSGDLIVCDHSKNSCSVSFLSSRPGETLLPVLEACVNASSHANNQRSGFSRSLLDPTCLSVHQAPESVSRGSRTGQERSSDAVLVAIVLDQDHGTLFSSEFDSTDA